MAATAATATVRIRNTHRITVTRRALPHARIAISHRMNNNNNNNNDPPPPADAAADAAAAPIETVHRVISDAESFAESFAEPPPPEEERRNDPPRERSQRDSLAAAESRQGEQDEEDAAGGEEEATKRPAVPQEGSGTNVAPASHSGGQTGSSSHQRYSSLPIHPLSAQLQGSSPPLREGLSSFVASSASQPASGVPLPPPPYANPPVHPHVFSPGAFGVHPPPCLPQLPPFFPPVEQGHPAVALAHYYELQMRDHAAAYASAAAGAAWAAYQLSQTPVFTASPPPQEWAYYPPPMGPTPTQPFSAPSHAPPPFSPHNSAPQGGYPSPMHAAASARPWDHTSERVREEEGRHDGGPHRPSRQRKRVHQAQRPSEVAVGKVRRRLRSDNDSSSSGSSSSWRHRPRHCKKKKPLSDDSLLGKTAVSALYEWCSKRQRNPVVTLIGGAPSFDTTIALDGTTVGRGRGANKNAAKQWAARQALQRLVPGIVFDETTGVLTSLPPSPEDLAHLAKQLAIKHEDDDGRLPSDQKEQHKQDGPHPGEPQPPQQQQQQQQQPTMHHPPKRTLDVYPGTSTTSEDDDENAYYSTRGASVCSSLLHNMINIDPNLPEAPVYLYTVDPSWPGTRQNAQLRRKVAGSSQSTVLKVHRAAFTCTAQLVQVQATSGERTTLETTGTGPTKRESRHVAAARLLALLFPDCATMVQVKEAAEAVHETYSQSRRDSKPSALGREQHRPTVMSILQDSLSRLSAVPLPPLVLAQVKQVLEFPSVSSLIPDADTQARQQSRLTQMDAMVDRVLQQEEDESLPVELTEDDVGRTILRRAGPEDLPHIRKLLRERDASDDELTTRLWSTCSFVLLFCRAIATFQPPLGCAVLTLGFDLTKGKTLRVAQIANAPHLPVERLMECLQTFAVGMEATLVTQKVGPVSAMLSTASLRSVLEFQVHPPAEAPPASIASSFQRDWPLQSVQEEEESEGASSSERRSKPQASKPSKRSRRL